MKTKTKITAVAVLLTLLLSVCGCAASNSSTPSEESGGHEILASPATPEMLMIGFERGRDFDFRGAIIEQINLSRTVSSDSENHARYSQYRTSEITEFYFPHIEIDGFEMFGVEMLEDGLIFYYAPVNPGEMCLDTDGNYRFSIETGIQLTIIRSDADDFPDSLSAEWLSETLGGANRNGLIHFDDQPNNEFAGLLGNTWFHLYLPDDLSSPAAVRDFTAQLVESAELVAVR
jgi:hypothetical protein